MSDLRYIERYRVKFPLLGSRINRMLTAIEKILTVDGRGHVIYIEGDGGSGKSEALDILRNHFGYSYNGKFDARISPHEDWKRYLFSNIVDFFQYDTYYGLNIERAVVDNWIVDYKARFGQEDADPQEIFGEYIAQEERLRTLRFALANLPSAARLIRDRRRELSRIFHAAMVTLCESYIPIFCFDTAELLAHEDGQPYQPTPVTDALYWLKQLVQSPFVTKCVIIYRWTARCSLRPFREYTQQPVGQRNRLLAT